MVDDIGTVFRDFNNINDPASGEYEPEKPRIRGLLRSIRNSSGLAVTRNTLAALTAVTPATEDYMGIVLDDPDPSNNGYYSRVAAAWVWERGFPDTFARVTLGGTANAQTGSVAAGVDPASTEVFFATVGTDNTGPMTLSVDGETARDVVNAAGNALSAGEWTGTVIFFINGDGDYQLLIDAGAAASAAASAAAAAQSAADAQGGLGRPFDSLAQAESYSPTTAPSFMQTVGHTTPGDLGGGLYPGGGDGTGPGEFEITAGGAPAYFRLATDTPNIKQFGAVGNDSAIDTAAVSDAAEYLTNRGGGTLLIPEGRFLLDAQTILPGGTHLILHPDAEIELSATAGDSVFRWAGTQATETISPTADITRGSKSISVTAGEQAMFATGDVLKIETTDIFAPARLASIRDGELATVRSVSSGVINLFGTVKGNYLLADGTVALRKINMVNRPSVKGGKFIANGVNNNLMALRLDRAFMPYVAGTEFSGFDDRAIYYGDCIRPVTERIYAEHSESAGTGYGVSWGNATYGGLLLYSRFVNVRHAISTNNESLVPGVVRECKALHNILEYSAPATGGSPGDALDTHAASSDIEYSFNKIFGATGIGLNFEGRNTKAHGNEVYSSGSHGINVAAFPKEKGWVDIAGNKIFGAGVDGIRLSSALTANEALSGVFTQAEVRDNLVEDAVSVSIYVRTTTSGQKNERVLLEGNTVNRGQDSASTIVVDGCNNLALRGNGGAGNNAHFFRAMNCVDIVGDHGFVEFAADLNRRCVSLESVSGRTNLTGGMGKAPAGVGLHVANAVNNVTSVGYDAAACATPYNWGTGTGHQKGALAAAP